MSLNTEERKQLVTALRSHVERLYPKHQYDRGTLDHLIELYEKVGLEGLDNPDREAFLALIEEAL